MRSGYKGLVSSPLFATTLPDFCCSVKLQLMPLVTSLWAINPTLCSSFWNYNRVPTAGIMQQVTLFPNACKQTSTLSPRQHLNDLKCMKNTLLFITHTIVHIIQSHCVVLHCINIPLGEKSDSLWRLISH